MAANLSADRSAAVGDDGRGQPRRSSRTRQAGRHGVREIERFAALEGRTTGVTGVAVVDVDAADGAAVVLARRRAHKQPTLARNGGRESSLAVQHAAHCEDVSVEYDILDRHPHIGQGALP